MVYTREQFKNMEIKCEHCIHTFRRRGQYVHHLKMAHEIYPVKKYKPIIDDRFTQEDVDNFWRCFTHPRTPLPFVIYSYSSNIMTHPSR